MHAAEPGEARGVGQDSDREKTKIIPWKMPTVEARCQRALGGSDQNLLKSRVEEIIQDQGRSKS